MKMMFAAGFRIFVAACRCRLYDEVVLYRRLQCPDLYAAVVCDRVVMLISFRIDVSGEGLLAVIGENLEGASVDKDADILQRLIERYVQNFADVLIEALLHTCLVDCQSLCRSER